MVFKNKYELPLIDDRGNDVMTLKEAVSCSQTELFMLRDDIRDRLETVCRERGIDVNCSKPEINKVLISWLLDKS